MKSIGKSSVAQSGGWLGAPGRLLIRGVAVPGDHHGLFHHVDAVALHQLLQQVEDFFCSGALEGKNPLPGVAAAAALEGEEVGVEAVAAQAQVGPPDGVALVRVQDELPLRQLHHPRAQLVPLIVHVGHLKFGGVVVWDAVCAQTAAAAPHDARQRGNPIRQLLGLFWRRNSHCSPSISLRTSWQAGFT